MRLSPRREEVLRLLARGLTNAEIGQALDISAETVRTHVAAILAALGVSNRTEAASAYATWQADPARVADLLARPAIAVLPLVTEAGDGAAAAAAPGLTRDLVTLFSRWCWFPVIASIATRDARALGSSQEIGRRLGAHFLVDGMLRARGATWRLTVDIVETGRGECLYAESRDFAAGGLFEAQDAVCQAVVAAAYPRLIRSLPAGPGRGAAPPAGLEAWQLAHAGLSLQGARDRESNRGARERLAAAVERDPGLVLGHFGLGLVSFDAVLNQWEPRDAALDRLARCAERCLELAPQMAEGAYLSARHCQASGRHDRALAPLRDAIGNNPSFAAAHALLGQVLLITGDCDEGLVRMRHACRLGPRAYVAGLAVAHFARAEYDLALDAAEHALATNPRYPFARAVAAAAAWHRGEHAAAAAHARALRAAQPGFAPGAFLETFGAAFDPVVRIARALEAIEAA